MKQVLVFFFFKSGAGFLSQASDDESPVSHPQTIAGSDRRMMAVFF